MGTRGLEADVAALIATDDVSPAGGEQLGLEIFDDFLSPVAEQLVRRDVERTGRPGRPPGSKNRDNMNTVRLIKATKRPSILTLKELVDLPFDDFVAAYGFKDREKAFGHWRSLLELAIAYEEGRPTQRVELDATVRPALPVVMFGDPPVRPDLRDGNPPDDGAMMSVTQWGETHVISEGSQSDADEGAQPKAHGDSEAIEWPDVSDQ